MNRVCEGSVNSKESARLPKGGAFGYNGVMRSRFLSRYASWLATFASLLILVFLIGTVYPTPATKVLFLMLLFTASFGGLMPLLRGFYARRLPAVAQGRDPHRHVREAAFVALFLTMCAWLRMLRLLTWSNGLMLLGVLALIEMFWLSRKLS